MLERHHSQLLLALRDTATLAKAAQLLSISPSAASHRLREAEKRLGVELAEADGRSLRLTASGRHLAEAAAIAEAALVAGERTVRWLQSAQRTTVRLGLDFYDTAPWIVAVAGDTGGDHRVDVVRIPYGQLPEVLERRTVDLAVDLLPADADPGDAHQLVDDDLVGVVATGDPAASRGELCPADVAETYYLTAGETPTHGFEHSEFMVPAGVEPREVVRVESAAVLLRMIAAGRGITILPRLAVTEADVAGVTVVDLAGPRIPVRWVVRTRTDPIDATLQVVADLRAAAAAAQAACRARSPR